MPQRSPQEQKPKPKKTDDQVFLGYLRAFLVPTLVLKAAILYFGIHYSNEPDEGYGWGLAISIGLSLMNFALFIYKNWENEEES